MKQALDVGRLAQRRACGQQCRSAGGHAVAQRGVGPVAAVLVATVVVLVVLLGEAWCGLWLLGERFEKLDLSTDLKS